MERAAGKLVDIPVASAVFSSSVRKADEVLRGTYNLFVWAFADRHAQCMTGSCGSKNDVMVCVALNETWKEWADSGSSSDPYNERALS